MKKAKEPKKKTAKKKEPIKIEKIQARHDFTESEKNDLGRKLAGLTSQKVRTEEEKKVAMGDWNQKIKTIQAEIGTVSDKITAEWELRETECEVHFNYKAGTKTYIRLSDKKEIETRPITDPERQQHLRLEAEAKAPKIVPMKEPKPGEPLVPVSDAVDKAVKEAEAEEYQSE